MIEVSALKLTGERKRIKLISDSFGADFMELGRFPSFNKWDTDNGRHLIIEPSFSNLKHLFNAFNCIQWSDDGCKQFLDEFEVMEKQHEKVKAAKENDVIEYDGFVYETKPYAHQQKGFVLSRDEDLFAIFAEQGTGKTKMTIDTCAYLWEKDKIDMMIVIAPNGVHRNWTQKEIPIHMPKRIPLVMGFHKSGTTKKQQKVVDNVIEDKKEKCLRVFAFNVESFQAGTRAKDIYEGMLQKFRCLVVLDESDIIKNYSAKRSKYLIKATKGVQYKRILTGTPVTEGVENLYAQCAFLSPKLLGYSSYTAFKAHFCEMGGWEGRQVVGYKNLPEVVEMLKGFSYRVLKSECLDLPPKIYKLWPVDMTPEQKRMFVQLKKEWTTINEDGEEISETLAITRIVRCQQISSGYWPSKVTNEMGEEKTVLVPLKSNPKLSALGEVIKLNTGKACIWTRFRQDCTEIKKLLGDKALEYHGGVSADDREEAVNRFQDDPDIKYLILGIQAGCTGLTLTAADYVVAYCNHHGLRYRQQFEDRHHRIDVERNQYRKSILYIDMSVTGSADKAIINSLRTKKKVSDIVLEDPECSFLEFD